MCGIIGVVRRRSSRTPPEIALLRVALDAAIDRMGAWPEDREVLADVAAATERVDHELRGVAGVRAMLADPAESIALGDRARSLGEILGRADAALDAGDVRVQPEDWELVNHTLGRAKDAAWAISHDRLRTARAVGDLGGVGASPAAVEAFTSVQMALSALDRLEVRGRDSAGLHLLVRSHGLDLHEPSIARLVAKRTDRLFTNRAVRTPDGLLSFVYKAAAEIGELGDNTRQLREAIRSDELLHLALAADAAEVLVLGHTRWASVGIISEANAHPLNQEETTALPGPYVTGALNGDVDNYADLKALEGLEFPPEITTDAKVIPALVSRRLDGGGDPVEAFRATVSGLEGSVAIAVSAAAAPDHLFLAQRGSGQALYVGLSEDAFLVASEPYGLVEETSRYLRLDGETPSDPGSPETTRGQIVILSSAEAGELAGIQRRSYDGTVLPVREDDLDHAEITTRDIDRGDFSHYLLKEITEAPASFRKTLRGKIVERDGRLAVRLGPETISADLASSLHDGTLRRVIVIGQGTAAVAGHSLVAALRTLAGGRIGVEASLATELSGFGLRDDMTDTLVVAISQSGTTTDTNRTVDLARAHGAHVIAIVNRRNSDLVDKANGVLFTSDGRDVEMSVASTKAFYAQVAAGNLLALAIVQELGGVDPQLVHRRLSALRELPGAMAEVLRSRDTIASAAQRHVLGRRYWAVVGNGMNAIAANEIRIKLSELCYKAIACDVTEDKKHIDLSSEPLILVCAVGLTGSNADDVSKEVAIYRAHRAAPIVITSADDGRHADALETITVPAVDPDLDFVLATVAGHLFGYEAALAIDASARPLHELRSVIETAVVGVPIELLDELFPALERPSRRFSQDLAAGQYNGALEASTATRLASLLRYAVGTASLEAYELEHGKVGTPSTVLEDLTEALTKAIDELTRPIDAIKHQAKTVTVGISRSDETLLRAPLVRDVLAAGTPRDGLSYRALRTLAALTPAVVEVVGFTRYRIEGDVDGDGATANVVDRGGIATGIVSRTDDDPRLAGAKHRVASQREVTAVRGARDGRTLLMVPETKHGQTVGLTLLHVRFADVLEPEAMRSVLQGYQGRYGALKDAVTETEPTFDDAGLGTIGVLELLTEPVYVLARHWRGH